MYTSLFSHIATHVGQHLVVHLAQEALSHANHLSHQQKFLAGYSPHYVIGASFVVDRNGVITDCRRK